MGSRNLKKQIGRLLAAENFADGLAAVRQMPPRQAISPLFGFFCDRSETVKWHAVTAAGALVADLAHSDPELARIVVRRFIWNLNDESGGIGWGCPEAMGESLARSAVMAAEYSCILTSYIDPRGNYLEHPMLQRGAVWGVGRLAQDRPEYLAGREGLLLPYLRAEDPLLRATAVWAVTPLAACGLQRVLTELTLDHAPVRLYDGMRFRQRHIADLARRALAAEPARRSSPAE